MVEIDLHTATVVRIKYNILLIKHDITKVFRDVLKN